MRVANCSEAEVSDDEIFSDKSHGFEPIAGLLRLFETARRQRMSEIHDLAEAAGLGGRRTLLGEQ